MAAAARDVVVTGLGAVSAVARGVPGLWDAVAACRGGIGPIRRFSTDGFGVHTGAEVDGATAPGAWERPLAVALCRQFAVDAGREALRSARLEGADPARIALVFGTGLGDLATPIHRLAEEIADILGVRGVRLSVSTACSSSTGAIGLARELLALRAADVVLAGGADVLTPEVFAGFHALGVLSPAACAPFSFPLGTTLGEGAGFLVLEPAEAARARGATVHATLAGFGLSGDAWHETSPDPHGAGIERAIRGALCDAALSPGAVGYVNVHGSGTEANDPAEWSGIQRSLGAHALDIPLSSTKGALGHAQGAAGALEAIVTILAMDHGVVPPTLNFTTSRPHAPPDPVPGPPPRAGTFAHAVSVNAAFGGANAALVLSRPDGPRPARERGPVRALGLGLVGPWGLGTDAFAAGARRTGRVSDFDVAPLVPQADPRGLDPVSRYLTAAAALALREAGIRVTGPLRERTGLLVGQLGASPASLGAFERSIVEHGLAHLSATAFARIVLNAAAGACSKALALKGPLTAVTVGPGSGLAAMVLAAELLATRSDVALMIAGGADEAAGEGAPDGAACLVLGNANAPRADATPAVHVTGWALSGPGRTSEAAERALAMRPREGRAPACFESGAAAGASPSALAVAEALLALRAGEVARALVTSAAGASACAALLLEREDAA